MWKSIVAYPDRFGAKTSAFLDEFVEKGKLSRTGTFTLFDTVGQLVPYELLPLRIKRIVNLMPLDRQKFKNMHQYKGAILNLYIYGYLPDADKAIIAREQHWREFRRKWHIDNPGCRAKPDSEQQDKIVAWAKSQEDMRLYKQAAGFCPSSSVSSPSVETLLALDAAP
jgi:hypothetical protein